MNPIIRQITAVSLVALTSNASSISAEVPGGHPFAMRGVELGISLAEFKAIPVINDDDRYTNLQVHCSGDPAMKQDYIAGFSIDDLRDGIIACEWQSQLKSLRWDVPSRHWIKLGTGMGQPTFLFIKTADGPRLFRIWIYANNEYYPGILDALARNYGLPANKVEPFQTKAGQNYTSTTSTWNNGLSTITLIERCGHLERYCLIYDHAALKPGYDQLLEARARSAADKI